MMLQIDHGSLENDVPWKIRLEGKLQNGMSDKELMSDRSSNFRFLSFFERVRIEFPGNEEVY